MTESTKHEIHHLMILDSSGSMSTVKQDTIGGFNENLKALRNEETPDNIEQVISLVTFSDKINLDAAIWREKLEKIDDLSDESYMPGGGTALFDAIGMSVNKLEQEIKSKLDGEDANVVVTIFTDGEENSSREFNDFSKLQALIKRLQDSRMWTFSFIGCDEKTLEAAKTMGISAANVMRYAAGSAGTQKAFADLATSRNAYVSKVSTAVRSKGTADYASNLRATQADFFTDVQEKDSANNQSQSQNDKTDLQDQSNSGC